MSCGPRVGSQKLTDKQSELQATEMRDYWGLKGIPNLEPQENKLLKVGDTGDNVQYSTDDRGGNADQDRASLRYIAGKKLGEAETFQSKAALEWGFRGKALGSGDRDSNPRPQLLSRVP